MNSNILLTVIVVAFWLGLAIAVKASKSTTSLFPIIPFAPGILWLVGIVVNKFHSPWGTVAITGIHLLLLLLFGFLLLRWRKEKKSK